MTDSIIFKDRYVVQQELARNFHSTTYIVHDRILGRNYVLKRMTVGLAGSVETVEQFEREASVLSHLDHPGLPKIMDIFTDGVDGDRTINFVREYIRARDLGDLVRSGKHFTETEILTCLIEFTSILEYLHGFSPPILHRNIKPGNILIDEDGHAHLVDFGFVKGMGVQPVMIQEHMVEESAGYIPPEMLLNQANPSSDICALGLSMIFALSHIEPILMEKKDGRPDFRRHVNISEKFAQVLDRMIEPEWKNRYRTAAALRKALLKIAPANLSPAIPPEKRIKRPPVNFEQKFAVVKEFIKGISVKNKKRIVAVLGAIVFFSLGGLFIQRMQYSGLIPAVTIAESQVSANKSRYKSGEPIVVNFSGLPGNKQDWITIVPASASDQTYNQWFYTSGQKDGTITFNGLNPGNYEIRLYYNWPAGGYRVRARHAITVTEEVSAQISEILLKTDKQRYAPDEQIAVTVAGLVGNKQDWLTVTSSSAPDSSYAQWFYTQGVKEGEFTFKGLPAGNYEVRLYFNWPAGGYRVQKRHAFTVAEAATSVSERRTVNQKIRIYADGLPIQKVTSVKPEFRIVHKDLNTDLAPKIEDLGDLYEIQGIPSGKIELTVKVNANLANPQDFPGDYYWEFKNFDAAGDETIVHLELGQVLHLLSPQDNREKMSHNGSAKCSDPIELKSPVEFTWEPLDGDIVYEYMIGTTDCIEHVAGIDNVTKGKTRDTSIKLDLPPAPGGKDKKYTFHLMAWREDKLVGRLYVHDQGGSDWNYGFRVIP